LDDVLSLGYARVEDQVAIAVPWRPDGALGALTVADVECGQLSVIVRLERSLVVSYDPGTSATSARMIDGEGASRAAVSAHGRADPGRAATLRRKRGCRTGSARTML